MISWEGKKIWHWNFVHWWVLNKEHAENVYHHVLFQRNSWSSDSNNNNNSNNSDTKPFSTWYYEPHNTFIWESLMTGFQNGLIYPSSISASQDICIESSNIFPLWNSKKWKLTKSLISEFSKLVLNTYLAISLEPLDQKDLTELILDSKFKASCQDTKIWPF